MFFFIYLHPHTFTDIYWKGWAALQGELEGNVKGNEGGTPRTITWTSSRLDGQITRRERRCGPALHLQPTFWDCRDSGRDFERVATCCRAAVVSRRVASRPYGGAGHGHCHHRRAHTPTTNQPRPAAAIATPSRSLSFSIDAAAPEHLPFSTLRILISPFSVKGTCYLCWGGLRWRSPCRRALCCEICSWHSEDGLHSNVCFRRLNPLWASRSSILPVDFLPDGGLVCEVFFVGFFGGRWVEVEGGEARYTAASASFF